MHFISVLPGADRPNDGELWVEWTLRERSAVRRERGGFSCFCNPWVEGSCRSEIVCILYFLSYVFVIPDPYRRLALFCRSNWRRSSLCAAGSFRFPFSFFQWMRKFVYRSEKNTRNSRNERTQTTTTTLRSYRHNGANVLRTRLTFLTNFRCILVIAQVKMWKIYERFDLNCKFLVFRTFPQFCLECGKAFTTSSSYINIKQSVHHAWAPWIRTRKGTAQ